MQELITLSTRLVVMSQKAKTFLTEIYQAPAAKIDFIPHGIPDTSFVDSSFYKDLFGVEGRPVLLTFGLLSPNKGIENVLNALPKIAAEIRMWSTSSWAPPTQPLERAGRKLSFEPGAPR